VRAASAPRRADGIAGGRGAQDGSARRNTTVDLAKLVSDLKKESDRLTRAIEALATSHSPWGSKTKTVV